MRDIRELIPDKRRIVEIQTFAEGVVFLAQMFIVCASNCTLPRSVASGGRGNCCEDGLGTDLRLLRPAECLVAGPDGLRAETNDYSHSIVAGGLLEIS